MNKLKEAWLKLEKKLNGGVTAFYGAHSDFKKFKLRDSGQNISFFLKPEKAVHAARNKQGKIIEVNLRFKNLKEMNGSPTMCHNSRKELISEGYDGYINNKYGIVGVVDPRQIEITEIEVI